MLVVYRRRIYYVRAGLQRVGVQVAIQRLRGWSFWSAKGGPFTAPSKRDGVHPGIP
ncbi:hypothetical protein L195_g063837, partial [Trifolium pratense]